MGKIKLFPTQSTAADPVVPLVPCTGIFLGPSKSGKTVALISLILEQYRGVFEKIYIFSPSVNISTWVSSQKLRLISAAVRVNQQFLCCWRLRNQHELEAVIEELSQDLRAGDPRTLQLSLRLLSEAKEPNVLLTL